MNKPHHCTVANAPKFIDWLKNRGGIAVWKSINLSNPGASWSSPATIKVSDCDVHNADAVALLPKLCPKCFVEINTANRIASPAGDYLCQNGHDVRHDDLVVAYPKPTWQAESSPSRIIRDPAEVVVDVPKEWKRFHVATRMGSQGLSVKVTDGGTRRLRAAVARCNEVTGKESWYEFDYSDEKNCVIMYADSTTPLSEWKP